MGCNCGGQRARPARMTRAAAAPDPNGSIIAAARAGSQWRLTTAGGTVYAFPTLAQARDAQRAYGGRVDRDY
jgi:hypothetical protein